MDPNPNVVQAFVQAHPLVMMIFSPLMGAVVSDLLDFSRGKVGSSPWSWKAALRKYTQATAGGVASVLITSGLASAVALMLWRLT